MSAATPAGHTPYYFIPSPSRHPVMAASGLFLVIFGAGNWINGNGWGAYLLLAIYVLVTHLTAVPELKAALKKHGREDIMIIIGGVVPPQDYDALYKAGAEAIFPPGTVIADAAEELIHKLNARLGHSEAAE